MAVTVRLMRFGKKGTPSYRVVVLDKRKKRDGSYLENIGTYDPMQQPAKIELKQDRFNYWVEKGAELSEGVRKLTKHAKRMATK